MGGKHLSSFSHWLLVVGGWLKRWWGVYYICKEVLKKENDHKLILGCYKNRDTNRRLL